MEKGKIRLIWIKRNFTGLYTRVQLYVTQITGIFQYVRPFTGMKKVLIFTANISKHGRSKENAKQMWTSPLTEIGVLGCDMGGSRELAAERPYSSP
jgi:hypothetical protein